MRGHSRHEQHRHCGVHCWDTDLVGWIARADRALYQAKAGGLNRVMHHDPVHRQQTSELSRGAARPGRWNLRQPGWRIEVSFSDPRPAHFALDSAAANH